MTKSGGWAIAFICFVGIMVIIGAVINTNTETENARMIQNHGTINIVRPIYYVDPRTKKCFAFFVNGSVASVECDDLVKSLMANDWINKE